MEDLEDKSTDELKKEFEQIHKTYYDLKERLLKSYDFLEIMEARANKIINILNKRTGGLNG
jgi:hydroxymethylpyrimidine pyrophosphatase-like HAD family hydrolase